MSSPMPITTLAPWFGGKRNLAPRIITELGDHRSYWEPFAGGISIIMNKPRARQECVNDLHGDITNMALVISSQRWIEFYERSISTLYCEGLYEACADRICKNKCLPAYDSQNITDEQLLRAWDYLVVSWMGRNGASGTARLKYQFTMRYTNNGGDSATRWRNVVESIPAWHDRLLGVVISNRDGISLAEKIEDVEGCAIYCDPPYIEEGDAYEYSFSTGGVLFGDDHQRLAQALCAKRHSRVVVSYYDHPRLCELYPGWTVCKIKANKTLSVQNKRGSSKTPAPETLLINGPSYAKENA